MTELATPDLIIICACALAFPRITLAMLLWWFGYAWMAFAFLLLAILSDFLNGFLGEAMRDYRRRYLGRI